MAPISLDLTLTTSRSLSPLPDVPSSPSTIISGSSLHSLYTLPIVDSIAKHEFLVNNMPLRGADICTVHIWLDIWFWAKRMDMATRNQIDRITWNAANVYGFSQRRLRHDLRNWGFEKKISKELARDIVKARKIVMSCHNGGFGVSRFIEELFQRVSHSGYT
jgi:hypothetical protein